MYNHHYAVQDLPVVHWPETMMTYVVTERIIKPLKWELVDTFEFIGDPTEEDA